VREGTLEPQRGRGRRDFVKAGLRVVVRRDNSGARFTLSGTVRTADAKMRLLLQPLIRQKDHELVWLARSGLSMQSTRPGAYSSTPRPKLESLFADRHHVPELVARALDALVERQLTKSRQFSGSDVAGGASRACSQCCVLVRSSQLPSVLSQPSPLATSRPHRSRGRWRLDSLLSAALLATRHPVRE
jgi:hypothetical protein